MALIRCEQCGKEISDTMNACPFCGNTRQKEEISIPFRVADLKTEENKPLMKEICTTVCGIMAACVVIRVLLPFLYEKVLLLPIVGNVASGASHIIFYGIPNSFISIFLFILLGCGWMILWYYLRSKPSLKTTALGIGIAGFLVFIGVNYAMAAITHNAVDFEYVPYSEAMSAFAVPYVGVVFPLLFFFACLFAYGRKPAKGILRGGIFLLISVVLMFIKSWVCVGILYLGFFGISSALDILVVLIAAGLFVGASIVVKAKKKKA